MRNGGRHKRQRVLSKNGAVVRLVIGHLAAVIAEWAAVIAVLVHVFDHGGTRATGFASIGLLVAALVVAPFAGGMADRRRPQRVRLVGLVVQAVGYAVGALAAVSDLPAAVTVAAAMLSLGAVTTLRPTAAILIPAHVRTSSELVVGNLWVWYVESFSVLGGPLLATGLLAWGGPAAVLTGCSAAAVVGVGLTLWDLGTDPPAAVAAEAGQPDRRSRRRMVISWAPLRGRPGLTSVLAVVWAQYVMIGVLDIVLVVLARTELDLGDAGPGLLSTVFGLGAVLSIVGASSVARRTRLAPVVTLALAAAAAGLVTFGVALSTVAALIVLPILGMTRSMLDGPSRLLLQRSVGPEGLGSAFAVREVCSSSGLLAGSTFALVALEIGDADLVLIGLGVFLTVLLVVVARGVQMADRSANVPVVEMSLLRRLPIFAHLPSMSLEAVARSASPVVVPAGAVVITQGERGDMFYAVVDGTFEVEESGTHIRTVERLGSFGEVALLSDVPRTGTVTASTQGTLLAIDRADLLIAVTRTDLSRQAAWNVVRSLMPEADLVPTEELLPQTRDT